MRLDFHNDNRLMQNASAGTGSGSVSDARLKEYQKLKNAYNRAKPGSKEQEALLDQTIAFARKSDLLQAGSDAANKLQTVVGEIEGGRATQTAAMGQAAGNADIQLQQQRGGAVISAEGTAASSIFNAKMIIPNMQLSMFGTLKMFASILESFGMNTKGFQDKMDAKIAEIKFPTLDTSRVSGVSTSVSSRGAEANVNSATDRAQGNLRTVSPKAVADMFSAIDAQIGSTSATAPAATGQTQSAALTSVAKLVQDHILTQDQSQEVMTKWTTAAKLGGDKAKLDQPVEVAAVGNIVDQLLNSAASAANAQKAEKVKVALVGAAPAPTPM